ncbi:MAG TPA: AMP-binding protein, partial [Pyrinomonadaceae bacterium]|nr:AMP-binding protein [Pyrinomonadaceae bacterium]
MNLFDAIFTTDLSAPAIRFGRRQITYGELRAETLKIGHVLRGLRVAPGDRVALLLPDSPEFVATFIATCSMGAIAVPINMALRAEEQCSILHNSGAKFALIEDDIRHELLTHAPEKLHSLENVVQIDRNYRTEPPADAVDPEFPEPGHDDPAFILYTSGSTGEPKGAVHTQADVLYTNQTFCREVLRLTTHDRLFSSSRLPFAYGLGNSFTFPLLNGATTILCRQKPSPDVIAAMFKEHRPTIFFGVPVIYNLLLEHHRGGGIKLDCSSLRLCVSAGEALPAHLGEEWEKVFGVPVLDGIGSTEMLHMFMSNHEGEVRYGSSGRLIDGYEAR